MPEYNSTEYWDKRYGEVFPEPFDWLFSYNDVKPIVRAYIKPNHRILLVGCGNAPFSPDLYDDGFHDLHNIDTSKVVIEQCTERNRSRRGMKFDVMDVTNMSFPDNFFDSVIDKSLVDTLMCCEGSDQLLHQMYKEIFRVMKPGAPLITFSLHKESEVIQYVDHNDFNWLFSSLRLPNPRYDPIEYPDRSRDHSFVACIKLSPDPKKTHIDHSIFAAAMKQRIALQIGYDDSEDLSSTSLDRLMALLDNSLGVYQKIKQFKEGERAIPRIVRKRVVDDSDEEPADEEEEEVEEAADGDADEANSETPVVVLGDQSNNTTDDRHGTPTEEDQSSKIRSEGSLRTNSFSCDVDVDVDLGKGNQDHRDSSDAIEKAHVHINRISITTSG